jgi:hypothetical protein
MQILHLREKERHQNTVHERARVFHQNDHGLARELPSPGQRHLKSTHVDLYTHKSTRTHTHSHTHHSQRHGPRIPGDGTAHAAIPGSLEPCPRRAAPHDDAQAQQRQGQ